MTSLANRRTAPDARVPAPAAAFPGQSAPSPDSSSASPLPAGFPRFAPAAAAATAGLATALPALATTNEPAPGGGPPQEHAGNPPSARESENVAGPSQNAEVRREMETGSSVG